MDVELKKRTSMSDLTKLQAVSATKWSGASVVTVAMLQFLTLIILARLLSPSEFGMVGILMVVVGFIQAFADLGLGNAIIQRQNVPEEHLSSFFWSNYLAGAFLCILIIMIRPLIALYFKQAVLSNYLLYTALIFLVTPVRQTFTTILRKDLNFKKLGGIEIADAIVFSASTIGFGVMHFGALSLILGLLASSCITASLLFVLFRRIWLPRFHLNFQGIRDYLGFGAFQMGERTLNYFNSNIDYIIIGRFLGPASLGFYTLAYQISTVPLTKINPIVTRVAFPAFSKIQSDDARLRRGYCKVLKYLCTVSFPMLAGMIVVAPEFVELVYGPKWQVSVMVLQILCIVGACKCLGNPVGSVLLAKGRADLGFYWNIFWTIVVGTAVLIGVQWGIIGVAVSVLLAQSVFFSVMQPIVNRMIHLRWREYVDAIKWPVVSSLAMLGGIITLKGILAHHTVLLRFSASVMLGIVIYGAVYYVKGKDVYVELKNVVRGR